MEYIEIYWYLNVRFLLLCLLSSVIDNLHKLKIKYETSLVHGLAKTAFRLCITIDANRCLSCSLDYCFPMAPINFCNCDTAEFVVGDKALPNISIL